MSGIPENGRAAAMIAPAIGVVIVAYSSGDLLDDCINAVLSDGAVASVVIVDNSSDPRSKAVVDRIRAFDRRVVYIDPHANLGFSRGCNLGFEYVRECSHVFFVNPDVILRSALAPLASRLAESPQKIVAARLSSPRHPGGVNARPTVTVSREVLRALIGGRAYRLARWQRTSIQRTLKPFIVDQVDGALLGMSAETFTRLGGFDPQFELYFDDVDLCARAQPIGGCLYVPEIWGTHVGGASSSGVSGLAYRLYAVSRVRYVRKHFGRSLRTALAIFVIAATEFVTRSLTRQSEGQWSRVRSLVLQAQELLAPGSVVLLHDD